MRDGDGNASFRYVVRVRPSTYMQNTELRLRYTMEQLLFFFVDSYCYWMNMSVVETLFHAQPLAVRIFLAVFQVVRFVIIIRSCTLAINCPLTNKPGIWGNRREGNTFL